MEINGDYCFEDFLKAGGASSDSEVSAFLTNKISKGFYSVDVENTGLACSTISAKNPNGAHMWGRNFDWTGSVPIIVKCIPKTDILQFQPAIFKILHLAQTRCLKAWQTRCFPLLPYMFPWTVYKSELMNLSVKEHKKEGEPEIVCIRFIGKKEE